MMATIRTGARIFKAATQQILKTKQETTKTVKKICSKGMSLARRLKKCIKSFYAYFTKKKRKKSEPILIHLEPVQENKAKIKHLKKARKTKKSKPKKTNTKTKAVQKMQKKSTKESPMQKQTSLSEQTKKAEAAKVIPIEVDTIKNFYKEWEANWGPTLTSLDKEFLESASPEVVRKVIANARLTLKSPYLKAVYNGLKDLVDISDLLEKDELAKQKILPFFKDYWERKPEQFSEMLFGMHDKGVFLTRSGERRLSLDPRLVPEWLGLVS